MQLKHGDMPEYICVWQVHLGLWITEVYILLSNAFRIFSFCVHISDHALPILKATWQRLMHCFPLIEQFSDKLIDMWDKYGKK